MLPVATVAWAATCVGIARISRRARPPSSAKVFIECLLERRLKGASGTKGFAPRALSFLVKIGNTRNPGFLPALIFPEPFIIYNILCVKNLCGSHTILRAEILLNAIFSWSFMYDIQYPRPGAPYRRNAICNVRNSAPRWVSDLRGRANIYILLELLLHRRTASAVHSPC